MERNHALEYRERLQRDDQVDEIVREIEANTKELTMQDEAIERACTAYAAHVGEVVFEDGMRAAISAYLADAQVSVWDAVCWFVEFPESGDAFSDGKRIGPATPMQWLAARGTRTADPNLAIRFCREVDAYGAIAMINAGPFQFAPTAAKAAQHSWVAMCAKLSEELSNGR